MRIAVVIAASLLSPGAARASDGVLEINQVCAANKGCFAGDSIGFPVTITQSGSYRLTGNLTVADVNTDAITVAYGLKNVSIDLNGFAIMGPVQCSHATPLSCPTSGTGGGVRVLESESGDRGTIAVYNGTITGMGGWGIDASYSYSSVHDLRVVGNASGGIRGSRVHRAVVEFNGGSVAISGSGSDASVSESHVNYNQGIGIFQVSTVTASVVNWNGGDGIYNGGTGTYVGNSVHRNTLDGIRVGGNCVVANNMVFWNGTDQIDAGGRCGVNGNTVTRQSSGFALRLGANAAYRDNTINSSSSADSVTGGVDAGGNVCNGGACP